MRRPAPAWSDSSPAKSSLALDVQDRPAPAPTGPCLLRAPPADAAGGDRADRRFPRLRAHHAALRAVDPRPPPTRLAALVPTVPPPVSALTTLPLATSPRALMPPTTYIDRYGEYDK